MTSPNEPGYPRATDGGANGSGSGPGPGPDGLGGGAASRGPATSASSPERIADPSDIPPWQRGRAAANRPPDAAGRPDSPARPETPRRGNSGATAHSPGVDARLNRFLSGGAAAAPREQDAAGWADPPEPTRPEPPARPE
ncbi:MAG TPA: hypothetical protein VGA66_05090, partial [Mycobacterium sp.]